MANLPEPNLIGLPEKYTAWRTGQDRAVLRLLETDKRFIVLGMPTGSGKSLTYMAGGVLDEDAPALYLTSTKGLQNQLISDFGSIGLADVRGMNNYACLEMADGQGGLYGTTKRAISCDEGPCLAGWKCDKADGGCTYFDAQRKAKRSHLTVTNYAYWMAVRNSESGGDGGVLGRRGRLVLDEAHAAFDELADHLAIEIGHWEIESILGGEWPEGGFDEWKKWARGAAQSVGAKVETLSSEIKLGIRGNKAALSHLRELRDLLRRLQAIGTAKGQWVWEESRDRRGRRVMRLDPVWPGDYAEDVLFRKVPKIVLTSATIRPKTLELLGIKKEEYEFEEHTSTFPVANRQLHWIPTVRVRHDMDPGHARLWVAKIDAILRARGERKGIIHTVSYSRRDYILRYSEFRSRLLTHDSGGMQDCVSKFRDSGPGTVLVSPSVSTGFDFPGGDCRFQIIGKVPFPDTRSKVLQARSERDPEFFAYVAMQAVVQMCGRGIRSADDWCENFVLDDNWQWFFNKYKKFAPKWFVEACKRSDLVPPPRVL